MTFPYLHQYTSTGEVYEYRTGRVPVQYGRIAVQVLVSNTGRRYTVHWDGCQNGRIQNCSCNDTLSNNKLCHLYCRYEYRYNNKYGVLYAVCIPHLSTSTALYGYIHRLYTCTTRSLSPNSCGNKAVIGEGPTE